MFNICITTFKSISILIIIIDKSKEDVHTINQSGWRMWIRNNFKRKIIIIPNNNTIHHFDKSRLKADNDNKSSIEIEKYSCWSIIFIGTLKIYAKIIHKGRGKFKIVEDKYKGKYVNKIVDASDVIQCIVKSDENVHNIVSKNKLL